MKKSKLSKTKTTALALTASITLLTSLILLICNLAVSHAFTWSLIPIFCLVFIFLITASLILFCPRRLYLSLLLFSLLLYPYLFSLNFAIGLLCPVDITTIGYPIAGAALFFLWIAFFLWHFLSGRPLLASALLFFMTLPLQFVINAILSRKIGEPLFDMWDAIPMGLLALAGLICLILYFTARRPSSQKPNKDIKKNSR